mmetsp:Transcript_62751/g.181912  ORF Transcript_62751/g.181912 Transcript_62751/m.181912 type:complete len:248 (+) Transcript_62751:373-1116(+)
MLRDHERALLGRLQARVGHCGISLLPHVVDGRGQRRPRRPADCVGPVFRPSKPLLAGTGPRPPDAGSPRWAPAAHEEPPRPWEDARRRPQGALAHPDVAAVRLASGRGVDGCLRRASKRGHVVVLGLHGPVDPQPHVPREDAVDRRREAPAARRSSRARRRAREEAWSGRPGVALSRGLVLVVEQPRRGVGFRTLLARGRRRGSSSPRLRPPRARLAAWIRGWPVRARVAVRARRRGRGGGRLALRG